MLRIPVVTGLSTPISLYGHSRDGALVLAQLTIRPEISSISHRDLMPGPAKGIKLVE